MGLTLVIVLMLCIIFESALPMALFAVFLALGVAEDQRDHEAVCSAEASE